MNPQFAFSQNERLTDLETYSWQPDRPREPNLGSELVGSFEENRHPYNHVQGLVCTATNYIHGLTAMATGINISGKVSCPNK